MTVIGWAVFVLAQLVWLPMSIISAIVVGSRQINGSKERGMSQTAIEVLYGRFAMHIFDMPDDAASVALVRTLATTSYLTYWLVMVPLWLDSLSNQRPCESLA